MNSSFSMLVEEINTKLRISENFDIVYKTIMIGERRACIHFIDGFTKDDIMEKLLEFFYGIEPADMPENAYAYLKDKLPYIETDKVTSIEEYIVGVLSGMTGLLIDGYDNYILIDCRTYPVRSIDEPPKEKVLRGSRDGFVETMITNLTLIRRRIRNTSLTYKVISVGRSSKTDVTVCFMKDRADNTLVKRIIDNIERIDTDALTMNEQSLAECLFRVNKGHFKSWLNPFPKYKYSERPDTTAAELLEGKIAIIVDNSPAAMILPTTVFDSLEEADDFYFPPITGTYLKLSRMIMSVMSLVLTPLFLLATIYPDYVPKALSFILIEKEVNIPILAQLLILELAIDGLKLAAVNTPNMLSTPLSLIASLVIGDYAVDSGWFNAEIMLYMAFVAFASYTHTNYEFGYALKLMRIMTLILTALTGLTGFIIGIVISILLIICNRTLAGTSYIYPLFPFDYRTLIRRIVRKEK